MADYTVRITFKEQITGAVEYVFNYVQQVSDPEPASKDIIIKGTRGDGSIRIKGGKKSQVITVRGKLIDADGYKDLTTLINEMRTAITTDTATLTMKHLEGVSWINDWSYTVFRNSEIRFPKSFRTSSQDYEIDFLVIAY